MVRFGTRTRQRSRAPAKGAMAIRFDLPVPVAATMSSRVHFSCAGVGLRQMSWISVQNFFWKSRSASEKIAVFESSRG